MALLIIITIVLVKYKPVYSVEIAGENVGYIDNKVQFEELANQQIDSKNIGLTVAFTEIVNEPQYTLTFVEKDIQTNKDEILPKIADNISVTYKVYAVTVEGENKAYVNTVEGAESLVEEIKEEYQEDIEVDLGVQQLYLTDIDSIDSIELEVAKMELEAGVEQEIIIKGSTVNGIALATKPVDGTVTSRFGSMSSVRGGRSHSGLDIGAPNGTNIKACAGGEVTYTGYYGGYGNLVIVSHGNGVETYYAHCSKMYVTTGDTVEAGDIIAAVGSTGNSTGNHLHLEVRVDGKIMNPQNYLYK